jgi:hypothetical protein
MLQKELRREFDRNAKFSAVGKYMEGAHTEEAGELRAKLEDALRELKQMAVT